MLRVLIAEDDWLIAEDLKITLIDLGCEVIGVASSAAQAIDLAKVCAPDLMLMDIRLDGQIGGVEAAISIRAIHNRSIPVAFISGNPRHNIPELLPPVYHLGKPWNHQKLENILQACKDAGKPGS